MAKGIICDRCGAVIKEYGKARSIEIMPYCGIKAVNQSMTISYDLCADCTETLMQYINNEVQMVLYKDKEAADDPDNNNPGI